MSMFPHTVTVWTPTTVTDPATMKDVTTYKAQTLTNVLLAPAVGVSQQNDGENGADTVKLYVPLNLVEVADVSEEARPDRLFTVGKSLFAEGDHIESLEEVRASRRVYRVNTVSVYNFGGLPNLEVGAN